MIHILVNKKQDEKPHLYYFLKATENCLNNFHTISMSYHKIFSQLLQWNNRMESIQHSRPVFYGRSCSSIFQNQPLIVSVSNVIFLHQEISHFFQERISVEKFRK